MQYLHMFDTASEFNEEYRGSGYTEPWVSLIEENDGVNFNKTEDEKLLGTPLTFEIIGDGNIVWSTTDGYYAKTIEYKVNDNEWSSITSTSDGTASIPVSSGDTVQFRGNNSTYGPHVEAWNTFCGTTAHFNVKGNIMSLIDSTGFTSLTQLTSAYTFYYLFSNCYNLVDASKLKLPATTLVQSCYSYMFWNCTSLTTAPELPATTLASQCYYGMFKGCTFLTTAPELPATSLISNCYNSMFSDCTSLNYIKAMFTTTPSTSYTRNWVSGVAASGTFVMNSAAEWDPESYRGVNGIPTGWTVQTATS